MSEAMIAFLVVVGFVCFCIVVGSIYYTKRTSMILKSGLTDGEKSNLLTSSATEDEEEE